MPDPTRLSACAMAEVVRNRRLSPVELVEAHLRRIEQLNPRLNAFVEVNSRAMDEARAAEMAVTNGDKLGPLHGVPLSIKSCIEVAGLRCEAGTRLFAGQIGAEDATLVARLRRAGAIVLGATNTPEFLMAYETDNALYGRTSNPWNLEYSAGGSSGGESAAIAACLSAGGFGSDGGGSIRVPAHFTGICGLKPTPGRIPGTGHNPPCVGFAAIIGVVGPMARTIADVRLLTRVTAGGDFGDPMAAPVELGGADEGSVRGLRVGVMEEHPSAPVMPETRAAVRAAADVLASSGLVVERFIPDYLDRARALWQTFFCDGLAMLLRPLFAARQGDMSRMLREFLDSVPDDADAAERVVAAMAERDLLRPRFLAQMERYPVLLMPVSTAPAFRHGEGRWDLARPGTQYIDAMVYAQWFNLLGNPAAVVPVGRSAEGLPIGVQIVGRPWEEDVVLAVAEAVERRFGYQAPSLIAEKAKA